MTEDQVPKGYTLVPTDELERLRAVDAKHGWKERPYTPPPRHNFVPHKKHLFFCQVCAYGPGDPLQHYQSGERGYDPYAA